ncbi:hypothetical protein EVC24_012 [Rhizobium phage RHph_I4]|nr:hypothetical protein EVC24_012 [Rhizobium phage RHph_I4]
MTMTVNKRHVRLGKDEGGAPVRYRKPDKISVFLNLEALDGTLTSGGWCHPKRPEDMDTIWAKLSEMAEHYHEKDMPFNVWYQVTVESTGVVAVTGSWQDYPRVLSQAMRLLDECLRTKERIDEEDRNKERVQYRGG